MGFALDNRLAGRLGQTQQIQTLIPAGHDDGRRAVRATVWLTGSQVVK